MRVRTSPCSRISWSTQPKAAERSSNSSKPIAVRHLPHISRHVSTSDQTRIAWLFRSSASFCTLIAAARSTIFDMKVGLRFDTGRKLAMSVRSRPDLLRRVTVACFCDGAGSASATCWPASSGTAAAGRRTRAPGTSALGRAMHARLNRRLHNDATHSVCVQGSCWDNYSTLSANRNNHWSAIGCCFV